MQHIAAQCTILSTSATSAHSYARASSIDSSSGQIIGGSRAGAGPATKHASCRTRLIRGPTIQQRGELLAEERPSSQGGLQPQNRAQRPLHRRRQFGIRGHGHDNMDLRTCANTGLTKKRSPPAAQLLRVAETSAPCSPRSAKMVPLAATEP